MTTIPHVDDPPEFYTMVTHSMATKTKLFLTLLPASQVYMISVD